MRLALVQPPIWGNLRTPWEVAYVKAYVERFSVHEVRTLDLAPSTLPIIEGFGQYIREQVDESFETECYLSSLAFLTSIAELYLIRLFYSEDEAAYVPAVRALLRTKTHHRGQSLDRLTGAFLTNAFLPALDRQMEMLCEELAGEDYAYVGCSTHITSYPVALYILRRVKRLRPDIVTVLSGYEATIDAEQTLRLCPSVDIVIRGESEGGYLEALSNHLIDRMVLDRYNKPLSMDEMPPPDYRDLDMRHYKLVSIMASRNCPHGKCLFCQEDAFWSTFRFRTPHQLVRDMEVQFERHGSTSFDFVDLDMRDFVVELTQLLADRGHTFRWSGAMRADARTPAVLNNLAPTKCRSIFFGFESGSHRLLQMMRKNITPETLTQTLSVASGLGIRAKLTCIAGLPTESEDEFQSTLEFVEANAHQIRLVLVQCFKLLKQSPLGIGATMPNNRYGLVLDSVPELDRIQPLLYSEQYKGQPSPEEAIARFIEARRAFRTLGVNERATLLSTNRKHDKHVLGLR
jgi:Radical SAM superfamily/B12 binding domain